MKRRLTQAAICLACLLAAGCTVPAGKQKLLARPTMQFGGPAAFALQSRLQPQIETGSAAAAGGQAAGCSSCR